MELHTLICTLMVTTAHASWWYLGMLGSSTLEHSPRSLDRRCSELGVLSTRQRELCARSRYLVDVVSRGAALGIAECQHQFRNRRWNCTTFNDTRVFGNVLSLKSREKAYIYAISSAGVMQMITRACADGLLRTCGCDAHVHKRSTEQKFRWGGCSHDAAFGNRLTREFVDTNDVAMQPEEVLMNRWNNGAGRKAVAKSMRLLCKCHGVSGSCSSRVCWRAMAPFRAVGAALSRRFDGAARMRLNAHQTRLRPREKRQRRPRRTDLVYVDESPDYCELSPERGSLGTHGRRCTVTRGRGSRALSGCTLLCCGRGYRTMVTRVVEDCRCQFVWCCRVECDKCVKTRTEHLCN